MTKHADHHYSVTVQTEDLPILNCLRALAEYGQKTGNTRIAWGGTKRTDWLKNQNCVTFHFSEPIYRRSFLDEANRILPTHLWRKVKESDNDPAVPQN